MTLPTKVPSASLGRIGSLKRTSDKSLFPMALGSCGHQITHQLRPINMNGRSILSETSIMLCRGRRSPSRDANFGGAGIVPAQRDRPVPLFSNPAPPRSARIPKKNLPSWGDSGLDGALRGDVRGRPSSQADPDRVEPTPNGCGFGSRSVEEGSISSGSPWVTTRMLRCTNHGRDYDAPIPGRFQQRFVHMEPGGRQFEGCRRE